MCAWLTFKKRGEIEVGGTIRRLTLYVKIRASQNLMKNLTKLTEIELTSDILPDAEPLLMCEFT